MVEILNSREVFRFIVILFIAAKYVNKNYCYCGLQFMLYRRSFWRFCVLLYCIEIFSKFGKCNERIIFCRPRILCRPFRTNLCYLWWIFVVLLTGYVIKCRLFEAIWMYNICYEIVVNVLYTVTESCLFSASPMVLCCIISHAI